MSRALARTAAIVPAEVEEVAVIAPPRDRHFPIAFHMPTVEVPARQTETLTIRATRYFRAHRIVVSRSVAPDFEIVDFKVGVISQIAVQHTGIPALVFHEDAPKMPFDTASPHLNISLLVRNVTDRTASFTATLEGLGLTSESLDDDRDDDVMKPWARAADLREESDDE